MNDKIAIQFKHENYTICSNNNLEIDRTIDKTGMVKSEKRYYNETDQDGKHKFSLDINPFGMLVSYNPNKHIEHNFIADGYLEYSKFKQVANSIEQKINDVVGIDVLFKNGIVSRHDNSFDVDVSVNYKRCQNVLNQLVGGKKTTFRNANDFQIKDSLYFGNKTEQIVIYNKTKEIKDHQQYYSYLNEVPENLIRIEHRRLKNKRMKLAFNNLNEEKYHNVRMQSINKINQALFSKDITSNNIERLTIDALHSKLQRNALNVMYANFLIYEHDINLNKIKVPKTNPNYKVWYDFKRQHSKQITIDNKIVFDIYNELKNKFNQV